MKVRTLMGTQTKAGVLLGRDYDYVPAAGTTVLIVGGSKSGKSLAAETLAEEVALLRQKPKYYLATLEVGSDPENLARVERHRRQRAGQNFQTLEEPRSILNQRWRIPSGSIVLLDCLGTLWANILFPPTFTTLPTVASALEQAQQLLQDLCCFQKGLELLLLVSNDVFQELPPLDTACQAYLAGLAYIHENLARGEYSQTFEANAGIISLVRQLRCCT